jgi:hypothetical protein
MKITMSIKVPDEGHNNIRFFDACHAASEVLRGLGQTVLDSGDADPFRGSEHLVIDVATDPDGDMLGKIKVSQ